MLDALDDGVAGEILFLLTGVYITYCIRNARQEVYREKWTLCFCVYIETVISSCAYIVRHIFWTIVHPDYTFLLYVIRCQLSVTVVLLILIGPKVRRLCRSSSFALSTHALFDTRHYKCQLPLRRAHRSHPSTSPMHTQIWYHHRPPSGGGNGKKSRSRYFSSSDVESRTVPGVLRLHEAIMSNGEVDITDINLEDMDPEDIRVSFFVCGFA